MIVDTGAFTDILSENTFDQINYNNDFALEPTAKRLFPYSLADHLETMGKFTGTFSFQGNQKHNVPIHVLKGNNDSLLSYNTAKALWNVILHVRHVTSPCN